MTFDIKGLRRIAQGPTIGVGRNSTLSKFMYAHPTDDLAAVTTAGYFNALTSTNPTAVQVVKGDQIDMSLTVATVPLRYDFIVDGVTSTVVSVKRAGAAGAGD